MTPAPALGLGRREERHLLLTVLLETPVNSSKGNTLCRTAASSSSLPLPDAGQGHCDFY